MVTTIQMMMTAFYITISIHDDDQGRRPNNEDRAAHQKVSCPWEGVRPVHIFTVRSILLCIFLLICSLSTSHLRRETHSSLHVSSHYFCCRHFCERFWTGTVRSILLCIFLLIILVNKVLDGHGGHFAADWVKDHLLEVEKRNIRTCIKTCEIEMIENACCRRWKGESGS